MESASSTKNSKGPKGKVLDLDSSSSSDDEPIKINEKFASSYDSWRRKEEISRLKSKYGDAEDLDKAWTSDEDEGNRVGDSESSEDDSDSSTDLDEQVFDKQFFKCYSALKKKDAKIYNSDVKFFDNPESPSSSASVDDGEKSNRSNKKITKPKMTLLDYHIKLATGLEADTPEDQMSSNLTLDNKQNKSHYERELDDIKNELKQAGGSSDEDDDLFVKKNSKPATSDFNDEKKIIINEEIAKDEDLSYLKNFWHKENTKLDEREKFLRDYILHKKYLNDNSIDDDVMEDKVNEAGEFFTTSNIDDVADGFKSEEDDEIEKNNPISKVKKSKFHSEEKNSDQIQRIPRNVTTTIRDLERQQTGKEKREARRERKRKEKKDDLNRLRLFKKQEMEEKLKKLRKISGKSDLSLENVTETLEDDQDLDIPTASFEDIVAGIPTKFKYRTTIPNDFGLTNEELLMATDQELNRWASLRKTSQYRSEEQEKFDQKAYDKQRNNLKLKQKVFKSIYGAKDEEDNGSQEDREDGGETNDQPQEKKSKKKHKRGVNHKKTKCGVPEDRLKAYGISKKKLKKSKLL